MEQSSDEIQTKLAALHAQLDEKEAEMATEVDKRCEKLNCEINELRAAEKAATDQLRTARKTWLCSCGYIMPSTIKAAACTGCGWSLSSKGVRQLNEKLEQFEKTSPPMQG